jgi:selenocysteine lyase/cysteine desulfurase
MPLIPCQRHLFEIPEDVAYFNCAYMSPLLKRVREAGEAAVRRKSRPWEIAPADFFTGLAETRELFGRLLGARPEDIAVIPAVSYGMATAARNTALGPGQRVLLLAEGFPSTIYAWKERAAETGAEAVLLPRPADDDWTRVVLEAIDARTGAAALPHCHWTDGGLLDLTAIAGRLREVGAVLALDVTQSLGAMPFDLGAVRPDWLVAATYKWLLGPYSMGFLYAAPERQQGVPLEHNWMAREGAEDFAALVNYAARFEPGARRYDVGEPSNFALTPMVAEALRQLLAWGVAGIYETLSVRTAEIAARAAGLGIGSVPAERRAGHYLGLRFRDGVPAGLPERLRQARVHVSVRGAALRVTPHLWTTDQDVERFFAVLG